MIAFLLVGLGGALGSMARYGVGLAVPSNAFPYATLIVNVIGCFCIGSRCRRPNGRQRFPPICGLW